MRAKQLTAISNRKEKAMLKKSLEKSLKPQDGDIRPLDLKEVELISGGDGVRTFIYATAAAGPYWLGYASKKAGL
jgi:hypothetical protein